MLLCGNCTPAAWNAIRADAGTAPAAIEAVAAAAGIRLAGFWFAFDDCDFYAILEGDDATALAMMRHRLMASGSFKRLVGEPLLAPDALIAAL